MASPPHGHPTAGQSSLEYVGVLTLVAAVLAAAGPAVGVPGVGTAVASAVRTGVCIVGGDVCRRVDAAAAGLQPCTLSDRRRGGGGAVTVLSVRVGGGEEVTVAQRSDGSVAITRADSGEGGLRGGVGFEAGPLRVGADGSIGATAIKATGWEFPDPAAARRFLQGFNSWDDPRRWPPAWRSGEAGLAISGWAGLGVRLGNDKGAGADGRAAAPGAPGGAAREAAGGADSLGADALGIEASAGGALGARVGRGETTLYLRAETEGVSVDGPVGEAIGTGAKGPVVAEYTRDRGGPRELAFRVTTQGAREGQVVETLARLDLRVPANRAVAERLLRVRAPWPPEVAGDLRAVLRHTAAVGTVERSVYAVDDRSGDLALAGRLGLELGVELSRTKVDRRLVSASAWTAGSQERAREDCLA